MNLHVEFGVSIFSRLLLVGACEGLVCMRLRNEEELQISDVHGPRACGRSHECMIDGLGRDRGHD